MRVFDNLIITQRTKKSRGEFMTYKTSEAQRRASKKWDEENPDKKRYLRARTGARTFARRYADREDMEELMRIFEKENKNA